jgi:hypothetical protein
MKDGTNDTIFFGHGTLNKRVENQKSTDAVSEFQQAQLLVILLVFYTLLVSVEVLLVYMDVE